MGKFNKFFFSQIHDGIKTICIYETVQILNIISNVFKIKHHIFTSDECRITIKEKKSNMELDMNFELECVQIC